MYVEEGNEALQKNVLSVLAGVVARLSFECLLILFTTDYDPAALKDIHTIAMTATQLQASAKAQTSSAQR